MTANCQACGMRYDIIKPCRKICEYCREERIKEMEMRAGYQEQDDETTDEPQGQSQEVFQRDHDRTVTQRPHTFTCKRCLETFTIMQYPAPSRIVCDECKTNEAAKQAKRDYMRQYMAATRRAKAEFQEPKRRGRPPRA